jgi:hypothetical protein
LIHNDIQNQLALLIKTSAPPLLEVADHAAASPEWKPGQQLPAYVLASLPNGRFQVQVEGQMLDLNLPSNTQPGETVQLTYVANTPRLTFALVQNPPPGLSAQTAESPVTLTPAAQLVGNLLNKSAVQGAASSTQSPFQPSTAGLLKSSNTPTDRSILSATNPVALKAEPTNIPAFAQALRTSIAQSGLFYESHQVEWMNGERPLAALKQEPQGQLTPLSQPAGSREDASGTNQPAQVANKTIVSGNQAVALENKPSLVETSIHPQSVPLVQQQLNALDARQVTWQGEIWPGQQMQWQIEEDVHREGGGTQEDQPSWHTRLNLQLPQLGGVTAKLVFVNGAVQLDIATEHGDSAQLMQQQQTALAERFASSGLQLSGVNIRHGQG